MQNQNHFPKFKIAKSDISIYAGDKNLLNLHYKRA